MGNAMAAAMLNRHGELDAPQVRDDVPVSAFRLGEVLVWANPARRARRDLHPGWNTGRPDLGGARPAATEASPEHSPDRRELPGGLRRG